MPTEVAFSASQNITAATAIGNFATNLYQRIRVWQDRPAATQPSRSDWSWGRARVPWGP